jgi:hypothetical protein
MTGSLKWQRLTVELFVIVMRPASALQKELQPGYRVVAEVFGAGIDDKGGMIEPIGQSTMKTLLAAHGDELVAFLAERGIKAA